MLERDIFCPKFERLSDAFAHFVPIPRKFRRIAGGLYADDIWRYAASAVVLAEIGVPHMARNVLLFFALCAIGLIGEITVHHVWFGRAFFDLATDLAVIGIASLIAACVFVIWIMHGAESVRDDVSKEEIVERIAEMGQNSLSPEDRANAIRTLTGTSGRRFAIFVAAYDRFGLPMLLFGALLCLIAFVMFIVAALG